MNGSNPPIEANAMSAMRHVIDKRRSALAALAAHDRDITVAREIMAEDHELLAALAKDEPPTNSRKGRADV